VGVAGGLRGLAGGADPAGKAYVFAELALQLFEHEGGGAFVSCGAFLGLRGEEAVVGVEDYFVDQRGWSWVGDLFGEVECRDTEAVEEDAGAAGVDLVGGELLDDFSDGVLDGRTVFDKGKVEGLAAGAVVLAGAEFHCGNWAAGGVVVVAEMFRAGGSAEDGALATAAVGEDVAADVPGFGG